jgi:hypothetical protein
VALLTEIADNALIVPFTVTVLVVKAVSIVIENKGLIRLLLIRSVLSIDEDAVKLYDFDQLSVTLVPPSTKA